MARERTAGGAAGVLPLAEGQLEGHTVAAACTLRDGVLRRLPYVQEVGYKVLHEKESMQGVLFIDCFYCYASYY